MHKIEDNISKYLNLQGNGKRQEKNARPSQHFLVYSCKEQSSIHPVMVEKFVLCGIS